MKPAASSHPDRSHKVSRDHKARLFGFSGRALAGYVLLTLGMTYPLVTQFAAAIPGDGFDGWQNYWNLWWVKVALLEQHTQPWFTDVLYYPTGVELLFHTLNSFNGFTFLPVQIAWGLLPAYNTAVMFSFALGGLGAYLLARYVLGPGASRWAAFIAGIIFTFSPYHIAHLLGHMQLISLEWIPFYVLYLLRTMEAAHNNKPRRAVTRNASLAALFLVLVTLCDWYYLMYCLIFTAAVAAWIAGAAIVGRIKGRRMGGTATRSIGAMIGLGLAWAIAVSPWLAPMVREARQFDFMIPDPTQSRTLSADLLAFVTPQAFHPLWGAWAQERSQVFTSTVSEYTVFAGFTALGLAGAGLWTTARRRRSARTAIERQTDWSRGLTGVLRLNPLESIAARRPGFWLMILLLFFILALGPVLHIGGRTELLPGGRELPLPYGLLARLVPFMDITRSVSRFDSMAMLALGVLAATGANWLVRRPMGRVVVVIAGALILFEYLPIPYPMSPPDTPAWYRTLAADPRPGAVLNLPMNWDRPGYLLYQTEHSKPLTAAYISREDPRTLADRAPILQYFRHLGPDVIAFDLASQGQQALADLDVRWVVLDRYKMPGGREREATEAYAAEIFGEQAPVYSDDRLTVYEVLPSPQVAPYLSLGLGWEPFDAVEQTRSFVGSARLAVHARAAGQAVVRIILAPDSAALALPQEEGVYVARLSLSAGVQEIELAAAAPQARVVISQIVLLP